MALHINIEDLLSSTTIESDRIEFKKGWNPDSIYRSICAFANDFDNMGGGYVVIGVEENPETKVAVRPVNGLSTKEIAEIQKQMIGLDKLIRPHYSARLSIETVDGNQIIVLWVVAGNDRPYEVPESIIAKNKIWKYYIRRYASSIEAAGGDKEELIALSNNIPFDDRANRQASIKDISMVLVQDHLRKIESKLADEVTSLNAVEVLQQMALLSGPAEYAMPLNVSLMMFTENPARFFPYTQVDIVYFPKGEAESFTEYPKITGTVPEQIKKTLDFLKTNFLKEKIIKPTDRAESIRIWNYPIQAIEETVVNAFYHRDYQLREPIEIRIYANSIIFLNYGGPDRSIQLQSFQTGQVRPRRYRNRKLGDFLKELDLTEGRATGIPMIFKALKNNGSPVPRFNTDDDHSFFEVELYVHHDFYEFPPIDVDTIKRTKVGIDIVLDRILEQAGYLVNDEVNAIADAIADDTQSIDNKIDDVLGKAGNAIAGAIAGVIADKELELLKSSRQPVNREKLLASIKLQNHRDNYIEYVKPLIDLKWITMTLPDKRTSPNQQYIVTLKGWLVLRILELK